MSQLKSYTNIVFIVLIGIFASVSVLIFNNVYNATHLIIDEIFHIPQGLQYCNMNFSTWDPKITTLPGLYLVSAALMGPLGFCTVYWLRFVNLLAATLNLYLFKSLLHVEQYGLNSKKPVSWSTIISSFNLGLLPPLYFFSHLYYTDTISITAVLLTVLLAKKDYHIFASFVGAASIVVRQTNVIWVGMVFGQYLLETFVYMSKTKHKSPKSHYNFWDLYESLKKLAKKEFRFYRISRKVWLSCYSYLSVMIAFCVFVISNGSIVVGDKSAHTATLHLPQFFYFSLFCGIFAFPHFCLEIIPFLKFVYKRKLLSFAALGTALLIVHYNTLVHPYLLADNRHYTFYVWNRIYAKYSLARYLLTVPYLFALYASFKRIDLRENFGFALVFVPCTILILVLQKMIDVRYFLTPFILLRTKFSNSNIFVLVAESLFYLFINYQTFYLFFTKEIYWSDFDYVQRIIW